MPAILAVKKHIEEKERLEESQKSVVREDWFSGEVTTLSTGGERESKPVEVTAHEVPQIGLTPYRDYYGELGQDYSGNVFLIDYYGRLVAVMSRHQFDNEVPSEAISVDRGTIPLDSNRVFKQEDVQIIPVNASRNQVQYVEFSPDYHLSNGESLWIARGANGEGTMGKFWGPSDGYSPSEGPTELVMRLDATVDVRGASGMPVFQVSTGMPVGVLLAADDGENATRIVFEPICLPSLKK